MHERHSKREVSKMWFDIYGKKHAKKNPFSYISSLYLRELSVAQIYRKGGLIGPSVQRDLCYPFLFCTSEQCCGRRLAVLLFIRPTWDVGS